jgi:hypothetical protein
MATTGTGAAWGGASEQRAAVAAASRRYLARLAHRYVALGVAAGFLAVVVTWFPSVVPDVLSAAPAPVPTTSVPAGGSRLSARGDTTSVVPLASGALGPAGGSVGAGFPSGLGALDAGLVGTGSLPASSPATDTGGLPAGGQAPAPITTTTGKPAPTCPLRAPSLPGTAASLPQADALLEALTGLCAVATEVPGLVPQLPTILTELPGALSSGSLPPALEALVQSLAFDVVIPLVSVLPLPSSFGPGSGPVSLPGFGAGAVTLGPGPAEALALVPAAHGLAPAALFALRQPNVPTAPLASSLRAVIAAGVAPLLELVPAPTGSPAAMVGWASQVAQALPAGTVIAVDATPPKAPPINPTVLAALWRTLARVAPEDRLALATDVATVLPPTAWWVALARDGVGRLVTGIVATVGAGQETAQVDALAADLAESGLAGCAIALDTAGGPMGASEQASATLAKRDPAAVVEALWPVAVGRWHP